VGGRENPQGGGVEEKNGGEPKVKRNGENKKLTQGCGDITPKTLK